MIITINIQYMKMKMIILNQDIDLRANEKQKIRKKKLTNYR